MLEEPFEGNRKVPAKIEVVFRKGEKEIDGRIKVLRMADQVSWLAVNKYKAYPLCEGEEDDKKWKQAIREAKEEKGKRRNSFGYSNSKDRSWNNGGKDGYSWDGYRRQYNRGRLGGSDSRSD